MSHNGATKVQCEVTVGEGRGICHVEELPNT